LSTWNHLIKEIIRIRNPAKRTAGKRRINIEEATGTLSQGSDRRMSEVKIARFVGIEACKSIFSDKSTFVLRSPEHYQRLYETSEGTIGDKDESPGYLGYVMSCWTKLKTSKPTRKEWDIFKKDNQNIVAIISTPNKVCDFLNRVLQTDKYHTEKRRFPFYPVVCREVNYKRPDNINHTNIADIEPFTKDEKFTKENEYRLILKYTCPYVIDSLILCGGIDYMEKCFANPDMCKKQREELQPIILYPGDGYGDFEDKQMDKFIANFNDLF